MPEPIARTLDCGLPLLVEPIPNVRSVGLTWLLPAGSAHDPADRLGLSAMWSEIIYRGAGDLDSRAHADALDTLGVSRGSSVRTFFLRLSATLLGERLLDALPLITDVVLKPRMDEASVEPVRDLCVQSLESLKDDPQERVTVLLREKHNPPPLDRSGLGTMEGLGAITRKDLVEGWKGRALPGGGVLAVAGAVNADALEKRLNQLLAGWRGESRPVKWSGAGPRGYHHDTEETNQVHIAIAFDAPREGDEASMPERVINAALSGGMSGRLFTEVREKRSLCYSVHASYRPDKDFGRVTAYSGTTPERAQETLDVLMNELRRINGPRSKGGGIDASEFQRAVIGMKSRLVMAGESTGARAGALADDWHKLGRPRSLEELTAQIDAVTLEQVNGYLSKRDLGAPTIVTIGPEALRPPG